MSTTISISAFADMIDGANAFRGILKRMQAKSVASQYRLFEGYSGPGRGKSICLSDLIESDKILINLPESRNCVNVKMSYGLDSNRIISIGLNYYGKEFNRGVPFQDCGPFRITMSINDLANPLWEAMRAGENDISKINLFEQILLQDAVSIFSTFCGFDEVDSPVHAIKHAAMYTEYGWPSSIGCSMIYHWQPIDFLNDFQRIYLHYRLGTMPMATFTGQTRIWELARTAEIPTNFNNPRDEFFSQIGGPDGSRVLDFLRSLDEQLLENLPDRLISFDIAAWFCKTDLSQYHVNYLGLANNSFALMTYPLSSLWRVYERFYRTVISSVV